MTGRVGCGTAAQGPSVIFCSTAYVGKEIVYHVGSFRSLNHPSFSCQPDLAEKVQIWEQQAKEVMGLNGGFSPWPGGRTGASMGADKRDWSKRGEKNWSLGAGLLQGLSPSSFWAELEALKVMSSSPWSVSGDLFGKPVWQGHLLDEVIQLLCPLNDSAR